jgi:hypothetical protein
MWYVLSLKQSILNHRRVAPKPSRPVVGKPVASSWGPSRQNSQGNSSEGGSTPPTSSRKKGKKGKTLLLYYG